MRIQRGMTQITKEVKTPEKGLSKIEISILPDAEFKILVLRRLKKISEDLPA